MSLVDHLESVAPEDVGGATLVARVYVPELGGPAVAAVRGDEVVDLTGTVATVSDLLERDDRVDVARNVPGGRTWRLRDLLHDTLRRRADRPFLLAPCDLQVIKACGVTFVRSMVERVIEEQAKGDPGRAAGVRDRIGALVGGAIGDVTPGTAAATRVKEVLIDEGLWSQYLEVGIGPDAEVFTKAPVLSAVGVGAEVGIPAGSAWNNPEPELVLAVTSGGEVAGATLGNDVNLRDVEGRSALLLGKAKDNNASCAVGPFIRLCDAGFGLDDVRSMDIRLTVHGDDGFELDGVSSMRAISRDPLELVGQAIGAHHRYPDGFVLFTGTMFAPTEDRDVPGQGFTHKLGDVVRISSPTLGTLVNTVARAEDALPWTFGIRALFANLAARGVLSGAG